MAKIILFGDSIFAGFANGVMHPVITNGLKSALPNDQIQNLSIPGHTTAQAVHDLTQYVLPRQPDCTLIFFGSNDASDLTFVSPADFTHNLTTMVKTLSPKKVILVSAPYGQSADRPLKRLAAYAKLGEHVATDTGASFINLYQAMSNIADPNTLLLADGIHFTTQGNQLLLQLLIDKLK